MDIKKKSEIVVFRNISDSVSSQTVEISSSIPVISADFLSFFFTAILKGTVSTYSENSEVSSSR